MEIFKSVVAYFKENISYILKTKGRKNKTKRKVKEKIVEKEKKEINGRFTQKLSRQGIFCNGSPRPPYESQWYMVFCLFLWSP